MPEPIALSDAVEEAEFGGKCVSLGIALRAGLPAPDGFALSVELVKAVVAGEDGRRVVAELFSQLAPALAVRSSAVGEDSSDASFAGQHDTVLNVMNEDAMLQAIEQVYQSAYTPEALAYRKKMAVTGEPAIAIALQQQILSDVAGVMFTKNPLSGESERYVEASWGLGEAIVAGLVVPDTFRLSNVGEVIEETAGEKDIKLVATADGKTEEVEVDAELVEALCLNRDQLTELHQLASKCEAVYGQSLDIEWAVFDGRVYLLQCRSITK